MSLEVSGLLYGFCLGALQLWYAVCFGIIDEELDLERWWYVLCCRHHVPLPLYSYFHVYVLKLESRKGSRTGGR